MILKIFKYFTIGIACLIASMLSSALLYRAYLQHKVAVNRAIRSPRGIQSLRHVHSGPGVAFIPLAGSFQDPWKKYFTVVQWDQRGAGKTYASNDKGVQHRTMNRIGSGIFAC